MKSEWDVKNTWNLELIAVGGLIVPDCAHTFFRQLLIQWGKKAEVGLVLFLQNTQTFDPLELWVSRKEWWLKSDVVDTK